MAGLDGAAARPAISLLSTVLACQHPALYMRRASSAGDDMNLPFIHGDVLIWRGAATGRETEQAVDGLF